MFVENGGLPKIPFSYLVIEIVVTPRSSMANEKNAILFWQNWVAHQLKNRPFCKIIINIHSIRMD